MELVIWNKLETDVIDVVLLDNLIKVKINDITIFNKDVSADEEIQVFNDMLDKIEAINIAYHEENIEEYMVTRI